MSNIVSLIKQLNDNVLSNVKTLSLDKFIVPAFAEGIASFGGNTWVFRTGNDMLVVRDHFANGMFGAANVSRYTYELHTPSKGQSTNNLMIQILNNLRLL